jgi:long-subunit fatty acid transport protein
MSRKILIALIVLVVTLVVGCGAFDPSFALNFLFDSPRTIAMGGAYVAVADDANAVFYNPAGLGRISKKEMCASYGSVFGDTHQYYLVGSVNLHESFGIGIGSNVNGFYDSPVSYVQNGNVTALEKLTYQTGKYAIAYGHRTYDWLSIGINVHKLDQRLKSIVVFNADPSLPLQDMDNYAEAYGADVGILINSSPNISIGALLGDAIKKDFQWNTSAVDSLPASAVIGLAYRTFGDKLLMALDMKAANLNRARIDRISSGSELTLINNLKIRAGVSFDWDLSANYLGSLAVGLDYRFPNNMNFEYVWQDQRELRADSRYFSVGCRF